MRKVALVGLGKWGKNHLRELVNLGCDVVVLLNSQNNETEKWLKENYPKASFTYQKDDIKNDSSITEVVIATPMQTHFELSKEFLLVGKKVFVEKPITYDAEDASALLALAEEKHSQFMVGHILLYHECFLKIKEMLSPQIVGVSAMKTARDIEPPASSKRLFLDSFIHEVSVFLKLFASPGNVSYNKDSQALSVEFPGFTASAVILPKSEEKIRQFEFKTTEKAYLWKNDELFEEGSSVPLCTPKRSPLSEELDIFLNRYEEWEKEISANNRIAVESVRILESVLK